MRQIQEMVKDIFSSKKATGGDNIKLILVNN